MIAIGIPSFNEADNIAQLVRELDHAASSLNIDILIINADNNSPDSTAKLFQATHTQAEKVSLITRMLGKGHNIKAIIDYIAKRDEITYCMFIDGDITSFDAEWLAKHLESSKNNADYVIPNYARYMQEGNTTNHFVYPLLSNLTQGNAPYQGIAGDFGASRRFALYLYKQNWPEASYSYGVDIFMTMHALFNGMQVEEITLKHKIHKPSFDKMVGMFQQVAESYFTTRNQLSLASGANFVREENSKLTLFPGKQIQAEKLRERIDVALVLFKANEENDLHISDLTEDNTISIEDWVHILAKHEQSREEYTPRELALSLTPFYILRVVTYLNTNEDPIKAVHEIAQTAILLRNNLGSAQ